MSSPRSIAVVLAGGVGARAGLDYPKQFAKVAGRMVIEHTLEVFQRHEGTDSVLVVSHPEHADTILALVHKNGFTKVSRVVHGGVDRFGSTWSALTALSDEAPDARILIHDAVRPFVSHAVLDRCLDALDEVAAVDVAVPTADTIIRVDEHDRLVDIPPRAFLRRGQTPQGFHLGALRTAYERASAEGRRAFTCDCGVYLAMTEGAVVRAVEGETANMKITVPEDLFLADKLFQYRGTESPFGRTGPDLAGLLAGKVVVVFGGSEGIGAALVEQASALGAVVVPLSRSTSGTDVGDRGSVRAALARAREAHGRIDYVVHTAAVLLHKPLSVTTPEELDLVTRTNWLGAVHVASESHAHLVESRGGLLTFTSSSYTRGRANYSLYSASKSAVVNLSQALAEEWHDDGVRVNCINPERTRTPMRTRNFGLEPEDSLLSAERVAEVALRVLVSSASGQVVDVRRPGVMPDLA